MARTTTYSDIKNLIIVVSFNRPAGEHGQQIRPVVVADEGAVRNITSTSEIGALQDAPLTLKQIYTNINKSTVGPILAEVLKTAVLEAISTDVTV